LLQKLAEGGFTAVPADHLEAVADECARQADATGDGRYVTLAIIFRETLDWWSHHDEHGGIPTPVAKGIDRVILMQLSRVLANKDQAEAFRAAERLADDLRAYLTGPEEWIELGYLKPLDDDADR
jgi:hypothetical protein